MSKLKMVRNIKGTKQQEDIDNTKEVYLIYLIKIQLDLLTKLHQENTNLNKEYRNLNVENQTSQKLYLNLNKFQANQRTISRGKLQLKGIF